MDIRTFDELCRLHRRGSFSSDVSKAIEEVVEAVMKAGTKGEVIIKLKIEPFQNATGGAVKFADQIKTVCPRPAVDPAVFFVTDHFTLTTVDPGTPQMSLRRVDDDTAGRA